jgi:UrcA family protein
MNRIIMLAALAAAPCFVPAMAQKADLDVHTEIVSYGDLDLADEGDVRTLDRRIRSAVQAVCGTASNADPAGKNDVRRCRAETAERMTAQRTLEIAQARQPVRTALAD